MKNRCLLIVPCLLAAVTVFAQMPANSQASPNASPTTSPTATGFVAGRLIRRVQPAYPEEARKAKVEGSVVLEATLGKDGTVQELRYVSGPTLLTQAAVDAVQLWQYQPASLNGEPVEVHTQITVNFALSGDTTTTAAVGSPEIPKVPDNLPAASAANPPLPPGVYRIGNGVSAPRVIYSPNPNYSEKARKKKYQGVAVLWVVVTAEGKPSNIRVARSLGYGLDEEAVKAVSKWKFKPAMKDGQPVPVQINVEVNFRLY